MTANYSIKCCVQIIEEVDHLYGLAVGWDCGEANNITEIKTDTVKMLWFDCSAPHKSFCHRPGEDEQKQKYTFKMLELFKNFTYMSDWKLFPVYFSKYHIHT